MDEKMAQRFCDLNEAFYRTCASSFSDTRHAAWPGWRRCLDEAAPVLGNGGRTEAGRTEAGFVRVGGEQAGAVHGAELAVGAEPADTKNSIGPTDDAAVRVLDVGCGNLRFEEYLAREVPGARFEVEALDRCDDLVPDTCCGTPVQKGGASEGAVRGVGADALRGSFVDGPRDAIADVPWDANTEPVTPASHMTVRFRSCDVIADPSAVAWRGGSGGMGGPGAVAENAQPRAALCRGNAAGVSPGVGADLAVAFGLFHHIPLPEQRCALLASLVRAVRPSGFACVSLWRFLDDEGMARRAQATHEAACAELGIDAAEFPPGDCLLGWQNRPGIWRYCHSFTDADIDDLIASVADSAQLVARFRADGRTGTLNEYLVFRSQK